MSCGGFRVLWHFSVRHGHSGESCVFLRYRGFSIPMVDSCSGTLGEHKGRKLALVCMASLVKTREGKGDNDPAPWRESINRISTIWRWQIRPGGDPYVRKACTCAIKISTIIFMTIKIFLPENNLL